MKILRSPGGLKNSGKKFWRNVLKEYDIKETHDLTRLKQACGCLDEIDEAEKIVNLEGMFVYDKWKQKKEHPAMKTIRDNKILFCRIIRELNLDIGPGESRPTPLY